MGNHIPEEFPEYFNIEPWYKLFQDVNEAPVSSPRGFKTKECLSYKFELLDPLNQRWCLFGERKLNIGYTCLEFLWYLRADNSDISIGDHAKIWRELAAKGVLQSNYGEYIFKQGQLQRVMQELTNDPDSRRASIMILQPGHFNDQTADIPCTLGLTFQIRNMRLNMHTHMRSSDIVFGMGIDIPCFTWTQELLCNLLKRKFPTLKMGTYYHTSDSMHVYERHFEMVNKVVTSDPLVLNAIHEPKISGSREAEFIINNADILSYERDKIPPGYHWALWLNDQAQSEIERKQK
jgi:thymidylate synthase